MTSRDASRVTQPDPYPTLCLPGGQRSSQSRAGGAVIAPSVRSLEWPQSLCSSQIRLEADKVLLGAGSTDNRFHPFSPWGLGGLTGLGSEWRRPRLRRTWLSEPGARPGREPRPIRAHPRLTRAPQYPQSLCSSRSCCRGRGYRAPPAPPQQATIPVFEPDQTRDRQSPFWARVAPTIRPTLSIGASGGRLGPI